MLPELFSFATFSVRNPRSRAWNLIHGADLHFHAAPPSTRASCKGTRNFLLQPSTQHCGPARGAICLLLGAAWIVNVNMTYSKERDPWRGCRREHNGFRALTRPPVAKETVQRLLNFPRVLRNPTFALFCPVPLSLFGGGAGRRRICCYSHPFQLKYRLLAKEAARAHL